MTFSNSQSTPNHSYFSDQMELQTDSPWDFKLIRDFMEAIRPVSPVEPTELTKINPALFEPRTTAIKGLGDFDSLFNFLGIPPTIQRPRSSDQSSALEDDENNESTPPTSAPEDEGKSKGVRWTDEEGTANLAQFRSHPPSVASSLLPASILPKTSSGRLPSPPFPALDPRTRLASGNDVPVQYTLTAPEQRVKLIKKLAKRFPSEAKHLQNPEVSVHTNNKNRSSGIHVFIDLSNIVIGFNDQIKQKRSKTGMISPVAKHLKAPPFSFNSLSLILERGRKVSRRVLAGSVTPNFDPKALRIPAHVREAERLGYETNMLERVNKPQFSTNIHKKRGGSGSGYATSGHSSESEGPASFVWKIQEQCVDELLQMKMLESLVDSKEKPSTIVLASGDAAEAEYSGGFLKTVIRALNNGWRVEIAAWKEGMSHEYFSRELHKQWGDRLRILELDDYVEEMLAVYTHRFEG